MFLISLNIVSVHQPHTSICCIPTSTCILHSAYFGIAGLLHYLKNIVFSQAFSTIVNNALQVATINSVGDFILFLGKCIVTAVTGIIGLVLLKRNTDLHFFAAPTLVICIFSFFIAHCMLSLYEVRNLHNISSTITSFYKVLEIPVLNASKSRISGSDFGYFFLLVPLASNFHSKFGRCLMPWNWK